MVQNPPKENMLLCLAKDLNLVRPGQVFALVESTCRALLDFDQFYVFSCDESSQRLEVCYPHAPANPGRITGLSQADIDCGVLAMDQAVYFEPQHAIGVRLRHRGVAFGFLWLQCLPLKKMAIADVAVLADVADVASPSLFNILTTRRDREILLSLSDDIARTRDRQDLQFLLKNRLRMALSYSDISVGVFSHDKRTFRVVAADVAEPRRHHPEFERIAFNEYPVDDGIHRAILESDGPVFFQIEDIVHGPHAHPGVKFIYETGIRSLTGIKLVYKSTPIGFITLLSENENAMEGVDANMLRAIANQVCTALANILANEEIRERESEKSILLSLSSELAAVRNKEDLFNVITTSFKNLFQFKGFAIGLINEEEQCHGAFIFDCEEDLRSAVDFDRVVQQKFPLVDGFFDVVMSGEDPLLVRIEDLTLMPPYVMLWKNLRAEHIIAVPMRVAERPVGVLYFTFARLQNYDVRKTLLKGICAQLAIAIANIVANEKIHQHIAVINEYKEKLEEEKMYLREEAAGGSTYNIIGNGAAMQRVFHMLSQVSPTESTVLVLGETGTGKELIARAIHNASPRKDHLMVKLNCSAIPANLIESELFGHEKGSFTGATERRIGKFELAHRGTLFLDEIGEMPLEMQAKLLRAIQEREIERVGGKATIAVNVRLIAATNRNLQQEVAAGRFRSDLYYRLNVFPIALPALRERKDDIPALVEYFIDKLSKKIGKRIAGISEKAMSELMQYAWPGNVRELEHLIERSVLLAKSSLIREVPLPRMTHGATLTEIAGKPKTLEENEREYIIQALHRCGGKVFGKGGAAELLGVKRSTLVSRMRKLGIVKEKTTFRHTA